MNRSNRREVRNPILALPSARQLQQLPPESRAAMRALLLELATDCRRRADESWRKHKAPMAAYWKAAAVYAGHIARVLNGPKPYRTDEGDTLPAATWCVNNHAIDRRGTRLACIECGPVIESHLEHKAIHGT